MTYDTHKRCWPTIFWFLAISLFVYLCAAICIEIIDIVASRAYGFQSDEFARGHKIHGISYSSWDEDRNRWMFEHLESGEYCRVWSETWKR